MRPRQSWGRPRAQEERAWGRGVDGGVACCQLGNSKRTWAHSSCRSCSSHQGDDAQKRNRHLHRGKRAAFATRNGCGRGGNSPARWCHCSLDLTPSHQAVACLKCSFIMHFHALGLRVVAVDAPRFRTTNQGWHGVCCAASMGCADAVGLQVGPCLPRAHWHWHCSASRGPGLRVVTIAIIALEHCHIEVELNLEPS